MDEYVGLPQPTMSVTKHRNNREQNTTQHLAIDVDFYRFHFIAFSFSARCFHRRCGFTQTRIISALKVPHS